jgi:hypothetical protein
MSIGTMDMYHSFYKLIPCLTLWVFLFVRTLVKAMNCKFGAELHVSHLCYFDKHRLMGCRLIIMDVPKWKFRKWWIKLIVMTKSKHGTRNDLCRSTGVQDLFLKRFQESLMLHPHTNPYNSMFHLSMRREIGVWMVGLPFVVSEPFFYGQRDVYFTFICRIN